MEELDKQIKTYTPSAEAKDLIRHTKVLLLVGPTGSGKNTLERALLKTGKFVTIITHTTRLPRINHGVIEKNGDAYYFISKDEALTMLEDQEFIEVASIHGRLYGTSISEFMKAHDQDKIAVADIDINGVRSYRQLSDKVTAVFLLPPSFKVLLHRLVERYGKAHDDQEIKVRLNTALKELAELNKADYYLPLVNDSMEELTRQVIEMTEGRPSPDLVEARRLARHISKDIKTYLSLTA